MSDIPPVEVTPTDGRPIECPLCREGLSLKELKSGGPLIPMIRLRLKSGSLGYFQIIYCPPHFKEVAQKLMEAANG